MNKRKGIGNSAFALLTSISLITGLTLLSFSGNPYNLGGNTPGSNGSFNPDMSNVSVPENTSVDPSNYINQETAQNTELPENQDLITKLAKGLFKTLSGQNIQPAEMPNSSSNQTPGNSSMNETFDENGTDGNLTNPEYTENQTGEKNTSTENETGAEDPTYSEKSDPGNFTNSSQNKSDSFGNISESEMNESRGLFAALAKSISSIFGSDNQAETPNDDETQQPAENETRSSDDSEGPSSNRDNKTSQSPEEINQDSSQSQEDNQSQQQNNQSSPVMNNLPWIIGLLAAAALLVLFYRSDKDTDEFIKTLLQKIKSGIISIPDLFRRTIVNTVSFIIEKAHLLADFIKKLATAPTRTIRKVRNSVKQKIHRIRNKASKLRHRSLKENLNIALKGESETYEGLDQVWHRLKQKLELENNHTFTPSEVRAEAVRQNLPEETVEEIVDAFRREKYSAQGYPGRLDTSKWNKDLEGDEN